MLDQNGYPFDRPNLNGMKTLVFEDDEVIEEEEKVSLWVSTGNGYTPAPNMTIAQKLPSGVYRPVWKNDDYCMLPVPLNTDELYRFSEDLTSTLSNEVKDFWDKRDIYEKHNLIHKRGLLLAGSPGCGKTAIINLLVKQIIENDGLVFFLTTVNEFRLYIEVLKPIIREIEKDRPIITVIEDIDQMIDNMSGNDNEILDLLDGRNSINHHLVIMTSNDTTSLSEALLRPSRIDMMFEIVNPATHIRKEFFERKGMDEGEATEYAEATEGMSFAELKEVFIGTKVLGKELDKVIQQLQNPFETKDYLTKQQNTMGI